MRKTMRKTFEQVQEERIARVGGPRFVEVKLLSCGCCNQGCVCTHHADYRNDRPPAKCGFHRN